MGELSIGYHEGRGWDIEIDVPHGKIGGQYKGPFPSGAPAIFIDSAARMSKPFKFTTGYIGVIGNDEFGTAIIDKLKKDKRLFRRENYQHNYPHCWRCDHPLIYRTINSWYVEVTKFKDKMVADNKNINWIPGHIKKGRFGQWLEGARDWAISRNRFCLTMFL